MTSDLDLSHLTLQPGGHNSRKDGNCATEAGSWLRSYDYDPCPHEFEGQHPFDCPGGCYGWHVVNLRLKKGLSKPLPHTANPDEMCRVLTSFLQRLNDNGDQALRDKLKPYIVRSIGTGGDGFQEARAWLLADWATRQAVPAWLELAGATEAAEKLRALAPIKDAETREAASRVLGPIRDEAWKRRQERWRPFRERIEKAVREAFEKNPPADAADAAVAAVAAVAADAADAAVAADAADAAVAAVAAVRRLGLPGVYSAVFDRIRGTLREKLLPVYREKFEATSAPLKASVFVVLDEMVSLGEDARHRIAA